MTSSCIASLGPTISTLPIDHGGGSSAATPTAEMPGTTSSRLSPKPHFCERCSMRSMFRTRSAPTLRTRARFSATMRWRSAAGSRTSIAAPPADVASARRVPTRRVMPLRVARPLRAMQVKSLPLRRQM